MAPLVQQSGIPRIAAMKSPSLSVKTSRLNVNGVTSALLRKAVLRQLEPTAPWPIGGDRGRRTPGVRRTGSAPAGGDPNPRPGGAGPGGGQRLHRRRRGLYPRLLEQPGPDGGGPRVRQQPRRAGRHGRWPGAPGPAADPGPALAQPQHPQGFAEKHRRPLRPGQRPVRAIPRPDHDVFGGAVPAAPTTAWNRRN